MLQIKADLLSQNKYINVKPTSFAMPLFKPGTDIENLQVQFSTPRNFTGLK